MTRNTLRSCRPTNGPLFVSLCETLSNKAYAEQQQQIQRAGNKRSHCRAAGRTCAQLVLSSPVESKIRGYHGGFRSAQRTAFSGDPEANNHSSPPEYSRQLSSTSLHQQRKPISNGWKIKTCRFQAIDPLFISGPKNAFRSLPCNSEPTPARFCEPFASKACQGIIFIHQNNNLCASIHISSFVRLCTAICRIRNSGAPRASLVERHMAGWLVVAGQAN